MDIRGKILAQIENQTCMVSDILNKNINEINLTKSLLLEMDKKYLSLHSGINGLVSITDEGRIYLAELRQAESKEKALRQQHLSDVKTQEDNLTKREKRNFAFEVIKLLIGSALTLFVEHILLPLLL